LQYWHCCGMLQNKFAEAEQCNRKTYDENFVSL